MVRQTAHVRRESVIRVAIHEFARHGYHGTSTTAIAERAGISQPYLYRLFDGKKAIFLAAARRCLEETRLLIEQAVDGADPHDAVPALERAYRERAAADPDLPLMQLQIYLAVTAADSSGDHEVGETVRGCWMRVFDALRAAHGEAGTDVIARAMLHNCLVAMGFADSHRVWALTATGS